MKKIECKVKKKKKKREKKQGKYVFFSFIFK